MPTRLLFVVFVGWAVTASPGRAQMTVENPEFAQWAKFKPGTTTVMKVTSEVNGMKSETKITTKLGKVEADTLTLDVSTSATVNGMTFDAPATPRSVAKTLTVPKTDTPTPMPKPTDKPEGTLEEGTETVTVGGVSIKTKWYKYKSKTAAGEAEGQMWTSDEVPGTVVKSVSKTGVVSSTMELVELKKP